MPAIRGIKSFGGPSHYWGYRINQPFMIHTCSSLSYSPLMLSGILYSVTWLWGRVGVLFRVHFHLGVHILSLRSKEASKSDSSIQMAAHASFPPPSFTSPAGVIVMPPSARITSIPWCSRYRCRNWTRRHEFKSWTRLIAFHIALIPLGKV